MRFTLLLLCCSIQLIAADGAFSLGLVWDANTDGVTKGYILYAYPGTNTTGTFARRIDTKLSTTYTFTDLSYNTTYTFHVTAYDGIGTESYPSTSATSTTPAPPITMPVAVTSANALRNGMGGWNLALTWTVSTNASTYTARLLNASGTITHNQVLAAPTIAWTFLGVPVGAYSAQVQAQNTNGVSLWSPSFLTGVIQTPGGTRTFSISP